MSPKQFWTHFLKCERQFQEGNATRETVEEFESALHSVVEVDWEIGPTDDGRMRLSLSPDPANARQVSVSRKLVEKAPSLDEWEIALYKPARKQWNLVFRMLVGEDAVEIAGTEWEVVLYSFEDGTFDIVFRPPQKDWEKAGESLREAAVILVDGEIGEQIRRERIEEIEVVEEWDAAQKESARSLEPGLLAELIRAD